MSSPAGLGRGDRGGTLRERVVCKNGCRVRFDRGARLGRMGRSERSDGLPEPETGGGVGVGWAFTPGVMLFMHADGASMPGGTSDAN